MRSFRHVAFSLIAVVGLLACTDHASLLRVDPLAAGGDCPAGGVVVRAGVDDNGNGRLDDAEVESSQAICDGEDGAASLVRLVPEPAGANCPYGGTQIQSGVDDDRDGVLEASEVDDTAFACDARATLVVAATVAPGVDCPAGGTRLDSGVDADGDGTLDPSEVMTSTLVCSGQDAQQIALRTSPLAPGPVCANGGTTIEWGVDDDRDGVLDDAEVDHARDVCDGDAGATSLVVITTEPAGANCATGGSRVDSGVDADGDGTLAAGEVDASAYVCNGGSSALASYRLRLAEAPPVAMRMLGSRAVATDGRTLVVSSTRWSITDGFVLFVYERPDTATPWHLATTLPLPAVGSAGSAFAVDGDVLAVAAPSDATEGPNRGAVLVYERIAGTWTPTATLLSGDPTVGTLGASVAVHGGTVVASASGDPLGIFTFRKDATGVWQRLPRLTPTGIGVSSLALGTDMLVLAGSAGSGPTAHGVVAVYNWVSSTNSWAYVQELLPHTCCAPTLPSAYYGASVAIDGGRIVVADPGGGAFGRALVFDRMPGGSWEEQGALTPADADATLRVSGPVAVRGDVVALSMLDDEFSDPVYSIRLFKLDALGGWLERQRLLSPDRRFNDSFGAALAASSDTLVVCAPGYGTPTTPNHGVCHDYRLAP